MFVQPLFHNASMHQATKRYVCMKSWIKKCWSTFLNRVTIPKALLPYLKKLHRVLKKDISWTSRQTTIALVLREEVEQFEKLMNNGMPLETLIHLVFKKDEEMISRLKVGISLVDIFCMGQKKLYFKYLKILSSSLNLNQAIICVTQIEKHSKLVFDKLLQKIAYPFFLLVFAFFMVLFFSDYVLIQMQDYISNGKVLLVIQVLKYTFGLSILLLLFFLIWFYMVFNRFSKSLYYCPFLLMKKMVSLQFVCIYQNLENTYSSTQQVLETMSHMDFSIVGMISNHILDHLLNGNSLEESFLKEEIFDSDFKKMLRYALTNNRFQVFFDLYIKKSTMDIERCVKRIALGIQLYSYLSIGVLVLLVYQIMMMPLNMLNQF